MKHNTPIDNIPAELQEAHERLVTAVDSFTGLRVVEGSLSLNEATFMCRRQDAARWGIVMPNLVLQAPEDLQMHVGQRYVAVERNGARTVVDACYLAFRGDDLVATLQAAGGLITKLARGLKPAAPGALTFQPDTVKSAPRFGDPKPAVAKTAQKMVRKPERVPEHHLPVHDITRPTGRPPTVTDSAGFTKTFQPTSGIL